MSDETDVREKAARAAFDAFYVEGTPYSQIERAIFLQVADAVIATITRRGAVTISLNTARVAEMWADASIKEQWWPLSDEPALIELRAAIAAADPEEETT